MDDARAAARIGSLAAPLRHREGKAAMARGGGQRGCSERQGTRRPALWEAGQTRGWTSQIVQEMI